MFSLRRVLAVLAVLAVAVYITCSHVWAEPKRDKELKDASDGAKSHVPQQVEAQFAQDVVYTRFADAPIVSYKKTTGEILFGLQVKPVLPVAKDAPARPRDYLVLVDTSASKALGYLGVAQKLVEALVNKLGADDRLALWTINVEARSLTNKDFKTKAQLGEAVKALAKEYPSGAVNLKKGLPAALGTFGGEVSRDRVVLFLGDGNSLAGPLDSDSRAELAEKMVERKVAFFAVPLGARFEPANLHGLINATGGKVVRIEVEDRAEDTMGRFIAAASAPILYPTAFQLPAEVTEAIPSKLPPLRGDTATLVVGKMQKPGANLKYTITGTIIGKETVVQMSLPLPQADVENFFLASLLSQWRDHQDRPALFPADRALAFAFSENQMARSDLISKGDWALQERKYDHAYRLYEQVLKLDPNDAEAKASRDLAKDLRDGKVNPDELRKRMEPKEGEKLIRIGKGKRAVPVNRVNVLLGKDDDAKDKPPAAPDAPAIAPAVQNDPLKDVEARRAVADQQSAEVVNDVIRRAKRLVNSEPDAAHEMLKRTLDGVLTNPDLSDKAKTNLSAQLQQSLQSIDRIGVGVKRAQADGQALAMIADARINRAKADAAAEGLIQERFKVFGKLMEEARYEQAFVNARDLRQDLTDSGQATPTALVAAYHIAQPAKHLQELARLRRVREERWLDVFLEVERAHMPFVDEPPEHFPTPAEIKRITRKYDGTAQFSNWTDWSNYRIDKYAGPSLGLSMPQRGLDLRNKLSMPISFDKSGYKQGDPPVKLIDLLNWMADAYDLTFDFYDRAFEEEKLMNVRDTEIKVEDFLNLRQVTLATVLKKLLSKIPVSPSEATYIIRRDTIEITTSKVAANEKVVRVYPVADILLYFAQGQQQGGAQIGQPGFQQGLAGFQQGLAGFQQGMAGFQQGLAGFQQGMAGFQGGLAGFQGGLAGFQGGLAGGFQGGLAGGFQGGLAGFQGGLAAGGFQGGLAGFQGGLAAGGFQGGLAGFQGGLAAGGFQGGLAGFQGGLAGFQGGLAGFQGGLAGFQGGLAAGGFQGGFQGGMAGFQGGMAGFQGGMAGFQQGFQGGFQQGFQGGFQHGLQMGGFQMGGQIMGSTMYQGQQLVDLIKGLIGRMDEWQSIDRFTGFPVVMGPDGQPRPIQPGEEVNNVFYFAPAQAIIVKGTSRITPRFRPPYPTAPGGGPNLGMDNKNNPDVRVANAPKKDPNVRVLGDGDKRGDDVAKKGAPLDPKAIWQDALSKGVEDPGIIIAVADFLGRVQKWDHVAEFLKADLRQGIVVKPWVYESLAIALRNSGGSAEEIERAELSAIDLQPTDAQGFLKAAKTMGDLKHYDRALAFCRQASLLEPNTPYPYADALNYAVATDDLDALQWASGNLLKQDWPVRNKDIQIKAAQTFEDVAKQLEQKNRLDESKKLRQAVQEKRHRDLVIKLSWQGEADLDLKVKEPTNTTCWALNRLTVGGGTLIGDTLADFNNETYMAAEAFSGEYEITVDKVWGNPLYGKAQLRVIRHQGTKDETEELITVDDLSKAKTKAIKIKLDSGRRKETAYVPPPSLQQTPDASLVPQSQHDTILAQLRDLADPENYNYVPNKGLNGGFGSPGATASASAQSAVKVPDASPNDRVLYQTRVSSFVSNSLDVTAQAVMSADRRSMRLSMSPVFTPVTGNTPDPKVVSSVVP